MNEDEQARADADIRAGDKIAQFLKDAHVVEAFARLEKRFYDEFKAASSDDARRASWAKASVLDELQQELLAVVSSGERARIEKVRAERASATRRR